MNDHDNDNHDPDALSELYQELILDHCRHPRNRRAMPEADRAVEGVNPMCGDQVKVYLKLSDHRLNDVSFTGVGCAICTASASMMTQAVMGRSKAESLAVFEWFHDLLTADPLPSPREDLQDLASLGGVRRFPMRVKCATLAWHALRSALRNDDPMVSTE